MVAIKYPMNFVSALGKLRVEPDLGGVAAKVFSRTIETLLAEAQTAYTQRRYADAVRFYKEAQSQIFWLLHPRHLGDLHVLDDSFVLPVGPELELRIAEGGLKLAEAIQPSETTALPPVGVTAAAVPDPISRLDAAGFVRDGGVPQRVRDQAALGVNLLGQGLADQAVSTLRDALGGLGQPGTPEARSMAASVALNLSAAQLLLGRAADAQGSAASAVNLFAAVNDRAGQAEALHNQAVALQQAGQAENARATFDRAAELVKPLVGPAPLPIPHAPPLEAVEARAAVGGARLSLVGGTAVSTALAGRFVSTAPATVAPLSTAPSLSPLASGRDLTFIANRDASSVALRLPGVSVAGGSAGAAVTVPPTQARATWSWGIPIAGRVAALTWKDGVRPEPQALLDTVYRARLTARSLGELSLVFTGAGESMAYLAHLYAFVIPQALGDCYSQLGDYARAESYYLQAAGYTYLNPTLEAPALWIRLAENVVRWGDSLYRNEQLDDCKGVYAKLITQSGTAPADSPLYTLAAFSGPAADARKLLANLAKPSAAGVNPALATPLLITWARWQYLLAGLDFFGTTFTPIFTFEYLQQAATTFAQQAVQAEREYIDFQSRSEAEAATRRELQGAVTLANAAVAAQGELWSSAVSDAAGMDASVRLAKLRAQEAVNDKSAYASAGYWQYVSQSIAAAHGAHSDWHEDEIRKLAANMEAGSWHGDYGKLAAAATLLGGQKSYEYQLQRLQDNINDMNATVPIAQAQAAAAHQRAEAARLQYEAARTRAQLSQDALNAFENEVFTPEVWARLAQVMRALSQDYQDWAIRTAKLMERAYNFENDDDAHVIRSQYPGVAAADNLLGADFLLRDISSFTYRFIAHQRAKQSQLKDVLSLANLYPFDFYNFLQTGQLRFETTLHDADLRHPGFYGQRLAGLELEVVGLLPPEGVHGTLRAGGVSRYRTADGGEKTRIHTPDTLALSEYTLRNDAFVFRADPRMHGLFEGHGVATTWLLDLPRRSNNLDYRLITDVRLVLYYTGYYEQALHDEVLAAPPKPGERVHSRSLLLRFDFPEVWYTLLDTGAATFTVTPSLLPRNETGFLTDNLAIQLATGDGSSPAGVAITLTPPGRPAATLSTDANGQISAQPGNPLAAALGGSVLGDWRIELKPPPGSPLATADGKLDGDKLQQVSLLLQYQFSWPQ